MIAIGLTAVFGVIALGILCAFFNTRRAERLADVRSGVEKEVALILRRSEDADRQMAAALERGVTVDQAIADYQTTRANLVQAIDKTTNAWSWDKDDLENWRREQLSRRADEVNRKLMLPAVGGSLMVIALTLTVIAILYNSSLSRPPGIDSFPSWQGSSPAGSVQPPLLPAGTLPSTTDPDAGPGIPAPATGTQPTVPSPTTPTPAPSQPYSPTPTNPQTCPMPAVPASPEPATAPSQPAPADKSSEKPQKKEDVQ